MSASPSGGAPHPIICPDEQMGYEAALDADLPP
jgi:hypothetical protein